MGRPIAFELDRKVFGDVVFVGETNPDQVAQALSRALRVEVRTRKPLFGKARRRFQFAHEDIELRLLPDGRFCLHLGLIDDEARETLIETLNLSPEFQYRG